MITVYEGRSAVAGRREGNRQRRRASGHTKGWRKETREGDRGGRRKGEAGTDEQESPKSRRRGRRGRWKGDATRDMEQAGAVARGGWEGGVGTRNGCGYAGRRARDGGRTRRPTMRTRGKDRGITGTKEDGDGERIREGGCMNVK